MTDFFQIELLYNQFENLTSQINELIQQEEYEAATLKVGDRDKLIRKIVLARKTTILTEEESKKLQIWNDKISEEQKKLIEALSESHREVAIEINKTKKKVKVSSAYDVSGQGGTGSLIDTVE